MFKKKIQTALQLLVALNWQGSLSFPVDPVRYIFVLQEAGSSLGEHEAMPRGQRRDGLHLMWRGLQVLPPQPEALPRLRQDDVFQVWCGEHRTSVSQ